MATSVSSTSNGASTVRLLFDPNTFSCPDYASDDFADLRTDIGPDDQSAITKLTESWTKANDKQKAAWRRQVDADEAAEKAEEELRLRTAAEAEEAIAKLAEEERLEAEKKKPKLGDFDANSAPPSFVEARISPFAQKKLEKREYCLLWPFTPQGLAEAATTALSSSDDISSVKLSQNAENQLTVQTGPSATAHKNMVRDDQLSWRNFSLGSNRYIKEIIRAKWPKAHVDALTQFFYLLETHSLREQEHGEQILMIYADRFRLEFFQTLGTPQSFNIARISDTQLTKIGDEYFHKLRASSVTAYVLRLTT
ncbi:hypothetical protein C8R43DRAFT_881441 [Mycena crocata]|nr:hypothetical protein C8R43DRAFT_881441 [Mycena crocata]